MKSAQAGIRNGAEIIFLTGPRFGACFIGREIGYNLFLAEALVRLTGECPFLISRPRMSLEQ